MKQSFAPLSGAAAASSLSLTFPPNISSDREQEGVIVDDHDDGMARTRDLYLSMEQKEALEEIWKEPQCSILAILPVGGGKTALFNELAKLNKRGEVSIMISPYRALLANQMHRARQEGLRSLHCSRERSLESRAEIDQIWNAARGLDIPYAQVIYVTPEQVEKGTFLNVLLIALAKHNLIRMIFLDEAHEMISGVASYYDARISVGVADCGGNDDQESSRTGEYSYYYHHQQQRWRQGGALAVKNLIHDIRMQMGNDGHVRVVLATATATESEREKMVNEFLNYGRPDRYPEPKSFITSSVFPAANLQFTTIFCCPPNDSDIVTPTTTTTTTTQATTAMLYRSPPLQYRTCSPPIVETISLSLVDAALAIIVSHFTKNSTYQQPQPQQPQQKRNEGSQVLICVRCRVQTVEIAQELEHRYKMYAQATMKRRLDNPRGVEGNNDGIVSSVNIGYWNGSMSNEAVGKVTSDWESGELQVVVVTPGFGTGIHNPNTDLVVVVDPPLNATVLLQQLGRAGRCGNQGNAIVLINNCYWQRQHRRHQQQRGPLRGGKQRGQLGNDEVAKQQRQVVGLLYGQMMCVRQSFAEIFGDSSTSANSVPPCGNCDRCSPEIQTGWQNKIVALSKQIQAYSQALGEREASDTMGIMGEEERMRQVEKRWEELKQQEELLQQKREELERIQKQIEQHRRQLELQDRGCPSFVGGNVGVSGGDGDDGGDHLERIANHRNLIWNMLLHSGLLNDWKKWHEAIKSFREDLHRMIKDKDAYGSGKIEILVSKLRQSFQMTDSTEENDGIHGGRKRCEFCFGLLKEKNSNGKRGEESRDGKSGGVHEAPHHANDCGAYSGIPPNQGICYHCDFPGKIGSERFKEFHQDGLKCGRHEEYEKGLLRRIIWWIWEFQREWLVAVIQVLEEVTQKEHSHIGKLYVANAERTAKNDEAFKEWFYQPLRILRHGDGQLLRDNVQLKVYQWITVVWYGFVTE